jgi:hypothetical protein
MIPLALAVSVALARPTALDLWRWQIEAMDWTWGGSAPDHQLEVFTRPVNQAAKDAAAPQVWVRTERFEGQWQSQMAKVAVDCRAGRVSAIQAQDFGGMNLSGEVRDLDAAGWTAPATLLGPILRSACGS